MIHIVPTVPPQVNGLADYCYRLWEHWPHAHSEWKCLAAHVPAQAKEVWPEGNVSEFETHQEGLVKALDAQVSRTVVLHYVGFAYHPKGVPLWLPKALSQWKKSHRDNKLIVMFHETYADQVSWKQSAFWLKPWAKGIMVSLAQLADDWITSCPDYARKINGEANTGENKGNIIPVGTNILPIHDMASKPWPLFEHKKLRIVVFGLPNTRLWALQEHKHLLRYLFEQDLVEHITLLGKPVTEARITEALSQVQQDIGFSHLWKEKWNLSPQELSSAVAEHDLGLLSNHPGILSKSGVYAMLCAHKLPAIVCKRGSNSEKDAATYPCIVNNESRPELCGNILKSKDAIIELQRRVTEADHHLLAWDSITAQWQQVLNRVQANIPR